MAKLKASDLLDVKEQDNPLIKHVYDTSTMWNEKTVVLHIINRCGHTMKAGWMGGRLEKDHKGLTACNLVEDFWDDGMDWDKFHAADEWDGEKGGYKFCQRCGTPDDFAKVIQDHEQSRKEWDKRYKKEQEIEKIRREQQWERTKSVAKEFDGHLQDAGFHTGLDETKISIEYWKEGKAYSVKFSVEEIE